MAVLTRLRPAALVLMLSLVSPVVVTAVCEVACLRAQHHDAGAAVAADCHGHGAGPAPAVALSRADQALCHDDAAAPSAIVVSSQQLASMPAVVDLPPTSAFNLRAPAFWSGGFRFRPPDVLLITNQLRI